MTDVEHVRQRMALVKAQDTGLGPADHQYAKAASERQHGPVVEASLETGACVLQAVQAPLQTLGGGSADSFDDRDLAPIAAGRRALAVGRQAPGLF